MGEYVLQVRRHAQSGQFQATGTQQEGKGAVVFEERWRKWGKLLRPKQ